MDEISRDIKKGIAVAYINGQGYRDIAAAFGVSTGTVSNVIKELKLGRLDLHGIPFDTVDDLKQLSEELKRQDLSSSQALLGLIMFERLLNSGVNPEKLDKWMEMVKEFNKPDFTPEEFFHSAFRLHELENDTGKPYGDLVGEYEVLLESVEKLHKEKDAVEDQKGEAVVQLKEVASDLGIAKQQMKETNGDLEIKTSRLEDLNSRITEREQEITDLNKEVGSKRRQKHDLAAQVDGKEQSLENIKKLGFEDEDLLRLQAMLKRMTEKRGGKKDISQEIFAMLPEYENLEFLKKLKSEQLKERNTLRSEKSILKGQVSELEQEKATLQGQIQQKIKTTLQRITKVGDEATSRLENHVGDLVGSLRELLVFVLETGKTINNMNVSVGNGQVAQQGLEVFIKDLEAKIRKNNVQ